MFRAVRVVHGILVMLSMAVIPATTVGAQSGFPFQDGAPKGHKVVSQETYNRVLDILFPRDEPAGNYCLVLRFRPSSHPESQVVVKRGWNKVEVIEYTSPDGNIYSRLNELLARGGKEDAVEMAKLIKIRRRAVEVADSQARQWHTGFFESFDNSINALRKETEQFEKTGALNVVLHGTFYDLWYNQGVSEMSFSFYDLEVDDQQPNGMLKIVQWMNAVRRDVERLK